MNRLALFALGFLALGCFDTFDNAALSRFECGEGTACPQGFVCDRGFCVVEPAPDVTASDADVALSDTVSPHDHCGEGGLVCRAGETCCGGECVFTDTDERYCGGCGTTCIPGETCFDGRCVCPSGFASCDDNRDIPVACTISLFTEDNCGGCEQRCAAETTCEGGVCLCGARVLPALSDAICCVDSEDGVQTGTLLPSDGLTKVQHCGACFNRCGVGETCAESDTGGLACACGAAHAEEEGGAACVGTESEPLTCCGGACVPPSDPSCVCGSVTNCLDIPGGACCDDACVDTDSDDAHCGACGNRCEAPLACSGGACVCPDDRPNRCETNTVTSCVDLAADNANCGACGATCDAGISCQSGSCRCNHLAVERGSGVFSQSGARLELTMSCSVDAIEPSTIGVHSLLRGALSVALVGSDTQADVFVEQVIGTACRGSEALGEDCAALRFDVPGAVAGEVLEISIPQGSLRRSLPQTELLEANEVPIEPFVWRHRVGALPGQAEPELSRVWEYREAETLDVVLGDLDGDGHIDVVLVHDLEKNDTEPLPAGAVEIFYNRGAGPLSERFPSVADVSLPQAGDVGGKRGFDKLLTAALLDVEGDGDLDIIAAQTIRDHSDGYNLFFLNAGPGDGVARRDFPLLDIWVGRYRTEDIAIGDINADTRPDIIFAHRSNDRFLFPNRTTVDATTGQTTISFNTHTLPIKSVFSAVDIADLDGDGASDLVFAAGGSNTPGLTRVMRNVTASDVVTFDIAGSLDRCAITRGMQLADFDGDGDVDVFLTADNSSTYRSGDTAACNPLLTSDNFYPSRIYFNDGFDPESLRFVFTEGPTIGEPFPIRLSELADFDGDGDIDILLASAQSTIPFLYRNDGDGLSFTPMPAPSGDASNPSVGNNQGLVCADLDGDGDIDCAFANREPSTSSIWENLSR